MTKTPQFDKALKKYFEELELDEHGGQWSVCRFSGKDFYVRPEDIAFYKKMSLPLPTLSPHERIRLKFAFYGYVELFKVKSALTGKQIVSMYPPATPFKIYEHKPWFERLWNPMSLNRPYDRDKEFFEQFKEFQLDVPLANLYIDSTSVNSDFCNQVYHVKNCYLVFDAWESEDSAYSLGLYGSRNCIDCFTLFNCDTCYECFESYDLYKCFFVEYSKNCLDSHFLFDCKNCSNCFGCVNLRHKKYYFFNQSLSKEEYEEKLREIYLGNRVILEEYKEKYSEFKKKNAIYRENHNEKSVNVFGDYIKNSKNCYACFYVRESENVAYSLGGEKNRDSYDLIGGSNLEKTHETSGSFNSFNLKFCFQCMESRDLEHCKWCENSSNCFGCIGLKNKSFCIFNKQYSEEEYWEIVDEIKTRMLEDKEYGEFFPPDLSPIPFNISAATSFKGYDDIRSARRYGYIIEEIPEISQEVLGEIIEADDLPEDIKDVSDDILKKIVNDEKNGKKFFYIKEELDFYHKYNLPLPQEHYSVRLKEKRHRFGTIALELYDRDCAKCGKKIESSYSSERSETVYCEKCYQAEVV